MPPTNPLPATKRPTVGLALRGASSRSIFLVGFLEVLHEQQVPIDYIAAMSGSAIVAAAYACGTLNQLREMILGMNKEVLWGILERSATKGGVYNLDKMEEILRTFTHNKKFEDVHPLMGFVAVDINKGEEVVLSIGDIAHAARITCTLPWVFEPVQWGNRTLVDGGIMSIIPGTVVQQAGIDIVIGVDLRNAKYIFGTTQIFAKRALNFIKRLLLLDRAGKLWDQFAEYLYRTDMFGQYSAMENYMGADYPGKFAVLGRTMDLALAAEKKYKNDTTFGCDLLVRPDIPHVPGWKKYLHLDLFDFSNTREMYELGRATAAEYAPKIWQMMADHETRQAEAQTSLQKIMGDNQV
jgi:NTE family protein